MFKYIILQKFSLFRLSSKLFCSNAVTELIPRVAHSKSELYQKLLYFKPNSPENSKVLKIAVLGCPNSGKSSLVNMLTNWDICAVSGKINTTRSKQTSILTQNNVQLCFVDLPGIILRKKGLNFKLERSVIRDPHAGIHESDLIICIVDVSHKASQSEISVELLKALHFFKDKPSILVLNKVDQIKRPMKLFDITRCLTTGVVGGRISHKDSYANRYRKRVPTFYELLEDKKMDELFKMHMERKALESGVDTCKQLPENETLLLSTESNVEVLSNKSNIDVTETKVSEDISNENENEIDQQSIKDAFNNQDNSEIENSEKVDISEQYQDYLPGTIECEENLVDESEANETDDDDNILQVLYGNSNKQSFEVKSNMEIDDPIIDVLKKQLMLQTASKEEVMERRTKWREIALYLDKTRETTWKYFDDVFAVSSVTGQGIERLRNYLLNRAKPGSWYFHSSLITDIEPEVLIQMVIRAKCLNTLDQEVPYKIKIDIDNYEKSHDGSLHIHAIIRCATSRELMHVLGKGGKNISTIADNSRLLLQKNFQTDVSLKLTALRKGIPSEHLQRMKSVTDIDKLYPSPRN